MSILYINTQSHSLRPCTSRSCIDHEWRLANNLVKDLGSGENLCVFDLFLAFDLVYQIYERKTMI
jgi:hypothetical protein